MDARTGEVYYSENADTRLHPASLTKMMTLYIAFEAVEHGEISLDTKVTISKHAASEPPSKLGLRSGQKIEFKYLLRAAAVKSANDAATAIGEALEGSEAAFARRMNRTAAALGMTRTTFKNAHGLTESGHLSTARDMTILGRHVLYDYPEYYNLFSRVTADAGVRHVSHTNRRLLESYKGADGIKTGYTRAAGFNLVASAERGGERVIATVFGGKSTATRNAQVAKLLDLGFRKAPTRVAFRSPGKPAYRGPTGGALIATSSNPDPAGLHGKTIRVAAAAVGRSLRPQARNVPSVTSEPLVAGLGDDIRAVLEEAQIATVSVPAGGVGVAALAATVPTAPAQAASIAATIAQVVTGDDSGVAPDASVKPQRRPGNSGNVVLASAGGTEIAQPEVVSRISTSGGRHWGVNVGRFPSRYAAEKMLLTTALSEMSALDGSLRKVVDRKSGFDANFLGMTREMADLACRRLQARQVTCFMIGPS
ncbi:D-alanyl-D-alanine carboxypeptidase family protein [Litorisediminicola beolgyonensis]|uniref:D-alanyl-D-alanine carboxypeptidase family protein n=1 Tax=Litorisediminicola beolgyonensis TaxID=1173614 RepID=A0ABW3ZES4_9RHOB